MDQNSKDTAVLQNHALATLLTEARRVSTGNIIRSADLDRPTREKLTFAGYLNEVIRGWYLLTTPAGKGTSTLWFSNYWDFIREYLTERFTEDGYCLTAESSLDLISGQNIVSRQVTIITKKPSNQTINLPFDTSILIYQDAKNFPSVIEKTNGINAIPLNEAICRAQPAYFINNSINMEICLKLVASPSDLSRILLASQQVAAANRLVGAFQKLEDTHTAIQIQKDMQAAGFVINPVNPFNENRLFLVGRAKIVSPISGRISAMWDRMREDVISIFPPEPSWADPNTLRIIEQLYNEDSYHSLSIEGYQVTPDLIERIKSNDWSPESETSDTKQKDALAAKGYHGAFHSVVASIKKVLAGQKAGKVFYDDVQNWYRELFAPAVVAGLLPAEALAGYRSQQVYISGSRHVPPPSASVLDAMGMLEEKLCNEELAAVRAILGHFIFVYIHPYMDGNGRVGRFSMNLMLVSGGFNWTVIRTSERKTYMNALETASVKLDIKPFAKFVLSEMNHWHTEIEKRSRVFENAKKL